MKVQEGSRGVAVLFLNVYQEFQTLTTHTLRKLLFLLLLLLLVVVVLVVVVIELVLVFFHTVCVDCD
jgi:hypothetical protein